MKRFPVRVKRTRRGEFVVRLPPEEREVLRSLPPQLKELMQADDPSLRRLFPPAYPDDPGRDEEYRRLMREDLAGRRLGALEVMERTLDAERLDEEQLTAWLSALNDLRLVLGTKLDVGEDTDFDAIADDDPDAPAYALYSYLTWLEQQVVDALAAGMGASP